MYKKYKGMKVEIWLQNKMIGIGYYVGSEKIEIFGLKKWTPKFRLGRRIYRGYECWWIPVKEAERIKKSTTTFTSSDSSTDTYTYSPNTQSTSTEYNV